MNEILRESPKSGRFEFQKWPVYREAVELAKDAQKFCLGLPKDAFRDDSILGKDAKPVKNTKAATPLNINIKLNIKFK